MQKQPQKTRRAQQKSQIANVAFWMGAWHITTQQLKTIANGPYRHGWKTAEEAASFAKSLGYRVIIKR